jgi:plasmid stabilization system protein ParE
MANVTFLPGAAADYQDAYAWYFARNVRAAVNFQTAVDEATRQIAADPERWPLFDDVHRSAPLRRYPYSLVYRVVNGDVVIVAVAHARRRPSYWQNRP